MTCRRYAIRIAKNAEALAAWRTAHPSATEIDARLVHTTLLDRVELIADASRTLAIAGGGHIIGEIFERGCRRPTTTIGEELGALVYRSSGDWLIQACWGNYVAVLASRTHDRIDVIRAPFGDLTAYVATTKWGILVASDLAMIAGASGTRPSIEWYGIVDHLVAPELPRARTCLQGVQELLPGERLTLTGCEQEVTAVWDPWNWTTSDRRLEDGHEAAVRLRDCVHTAVAAVTPAGAKSILRLSGGIDSSIVAASLHAAGRDFLALTLVSEDATGDERIHARTVASHLGVELVEIQRDWRVVDVTHSAAANLPRPSARAFAQASTHCSVLVAGRTGAAPIVDGGGGDNLFASLASTAPVADTLHRDAPAGLFWRTAQSIGVAARTSTLEVARRGALRHLRRAAGYRWPTSVDLLSRDAATVAAQAVSHDWLRPPAGAMHGAAAHVGLIAGAQSMVGSRDPARVLAEISPLVAQPVAETCLRIPSWLWTRGGFTRAIARDAFRPDLPAGAMDRRDKGSPDGFVSKVFQSNLPSVTGLLMEGHLVQSGVVDRDALADALSPHTLARGEGYLRLMQLVDAEAWLRSRTD